MKSRVPEFLKENNLSPFLDKPTVRNLDMNELRNIKEKDLEKDEFNDVDNTTKRRLLHRISEMNYQSPSLKRIQMMKKNILTEIRHTRRSTPTDFQHFFMRGEIPQYTAQFQNRGIDNVNDLIDMDEMEVNKIITNIDDQEKFRIQVRRYIDSHSQKKEDDVDSDYNKQLVDSQESSYQILGVSLGTESPTEEPKGEMDSSPILARKVSRDSSQEEDQKLQNKKKLHSANDLLQTSDNILRINSSHSNSKLDSPIKISQHLDSLSDAIGSPNNMIDSPSDMSSKDDLLSSSDDKISLQKRVNSPPRSPNELVSKKRSMNKDDLIVSSSDEKIASHSNTEMMMNNGHQNPNARLSSKDNLISSSDDKISLPRDTNLPPRSPIEMHGKYIDMDSNDDLISSSSDDDKISLPKEVDSPPRSPNELISKNRFVNENTNDDLIGKSLENNSLTRNKVSPPSSPNQLISQNREMRGSLNEIVNNKDPSFENINYPQQGMEMKAESSSNNCFNPLREKCPKEIDSIQMISFSVDPKNDIDSMIYEGKTLKLQSSSEFNLKWASNLPRSGNSRTISFIGKVQAGKSTLVREMFGDGEACEKILVSKETMKPTTSGVHWYGNYNCLVQNEFVNVLDVEGDGGGIPVESREQLGLYYPTEKDITDYENKRTVAVKEHLRRFAYIGSDVLVMVDETSWANRTKFLEMKQMAIEEATKDVSAMKDLPCLIFIYNKNTPPHNNKSCEEHSREITEMFFRDVDRNQELKKHYADVVLIEVPRKEEFVERYYESVTFLIQTVNRMFDLRLKKREEYSPFIWGTLMLYIAENKFHSNDSLKILNVLKQILLEQDLAESNSAEIDGIKYKSLTYQSFMFLQFIQSDHSFEAFRQDRFATVWFYILTWLRQIIELKTFKYNNIKDKVPKMDELIKILNDHRPCQAVHKKTGAPCTEVWISHPSKDHYNANGLVGDLTEDEEKLKEEREIYQKKLEELEMREEKQKEKKKYFSLLGTKIKKFGTNAKKRLNLKHSEKAIEKKKSKKTWKGDFEYPPDELESMNLKATEFVQLITEEDFNLKTVVAMQKELIEKFLPKEYDPCYNQFCIICMRRNAQFVMRFCGHHYCCDCTQALKEYQLPIDKTSPLGLIAIFNPDDCVLCKMNKTKKYDDIII